MRLLFLRASFLYSSDLFLVFEDLVPAFLASPVVVIECDDKTLMLANKERVIGENRMECMLRQLDFLVRVQRGHFERTSFTSQIANACIAFLRDENLCMKISYGVTVVNENLALI